MRASNYDDRPLRQFLNIESAERILDDLTNEDEELQQDSSLPQIPGYRIFHRIGEGGGGEVFFAARDGAGRPLAIKILRNRSSTRTTDPNWRELDILSRLNLSCVPTVHDYGLHNGMLYIVTDWVEGSVLSDFCRRRCTSRRDRVQVLVKVARAVQLLHERGVIHRDLKPSNIIVDLHDEPIIVDFGVADVAESQECAPPTEQKTVLGSPLYMAPEQARGELTSISTRTDVYGLAATACEILTNKTPHARAGSRNEMIRHVGHSPARDPNMIDESLPKPLAAVLAKALSFDTRDRYPSAREFADDLERWLRSELITAVSYSPLKKAVLFARRKPGRFAAGIAIAILTLGAMGSAGWGMSQMQLRQEQEAFNQALFEFGQEQKAIDEQIRQRELAWQQEGTIALQNIRSANQNQDLLSSALGLYYLAERIRTLRHDDPEMLTTFSTLLEEWIRAAERILEDDSYDGRDGNT